MAFSKPDDNVKEFGLRPNMTVVDLGTGSGAYSLAAGPKIPGGHVYAVDIQKELLEKLARAARERHVGNIEVVWGDIERVGGTKLRDQIADLVIVANVLFQLSGRYQLALEAARLLRPGGRVVAIDWEDSFGGLGPSPKDVVTAAAATEIFASAKLTPVKTFTAGDHHWGIIFQKPHE